MLFRSVETILRPKSLAIVGASERGRWPRDIHTALREHKYPGAVYLINPRQSEVYGEKAYASLRDLPEPVDHAIIIIPAAAVSDVLEDAAARGLKSATIYAGGVGDGENPASLARGQWVRDFIKRTNIRIAGPNCMGNLSYPDRVFAYPNQEIARVPQGPVGIIFQSGGTLQFFMRTAAQRGLRFSYAISSGNEMDLDLADYLNFLVDDPHTRQIVLFIEGIRRPDAFMDAAARALAAGKPIMAIKTGATAKSAAAAASHTGAIAGDYQGFQAMCERYGIINCPSLDDLVETALAFQSPVRPKGPRIGFVTTSGGTVDLLYDYVEYEGSELAHFTPATNEAIKPFMQDEIAPKNPLDVGIPSSLKAAADLCEIVGKDPNVDILAWASQLPTKASVWPDVDCLLHMAQAIGKPVIAMGRMCYRMSAESLELQERAGFPFLQQLQPSLRAMNALWFHAQRQGRLPSIPGPMPASTLSPENLEAELQAFGIHTPRSALCADAAAAAAYADEIGYPVVVKIQSPDILHKTEAGGVKLDLRSHAAVVAAAEELRTLALAHNAKARITGFLVQEMVSGLEVIIGARDDALYGPMLLIGSGGVLVELLADAALVMLPVDQTTLAGRIDGLKLARLLSGYRGKAPADRAALETIALQLGAFYLKHRAKISDIEINPLMVRDDGRGAVAVDVRVIWRDPA